MYVHTFLPSYYSCIAVLTTKSQKPIPVRMLVAESVVHTLGNVRSCFFNVTLYVNIDNFFVLVGTTHIVHLHVYCTVLFLTMVVFLRAKVNKAT